MVSIQINFDGLHYEDICIIKCKPKQKVTIDHIYVTEKFVGSLLSIFDFY
jgi:hypothetical protein